MSLKRTDSHLKTRLKNKVAVNDLLSKVISALPEHIYWVNTKNEILWCNDEQARAVGYKKAADIIGKSYKDLIKGAQFKQHLANNNKVFKSKKPMICEETVTDADKIVRTYASHKIPLFDDAGKVIGLLGVSHDITRQKTVEKKLQATTLRIKKLERQVNIGEDFLQKIIATVSGHFYWLDKNNVFLGCNLMQAKSVGLKSPQEIIGKTTYDFLPASEAKKLNAANKKIMRTGEATLLEESASFSGYPQKRVFLSYKTPLRDAKNKVIGLVGMSLDISGQKKLQRQLQLTAAKLRMANKKLLKAEHDYHLFINNLSKQVTGVNLKSRSMGEQILYLRDYLENIIAQMPGHVYWMDANNVYLGCNNLQAKHLGFQTRHEIVGKTNFDLLAKNQALSLNANNNEVMRNGCSLIAEELVTMKDGVHIYLTEKAPIKDKYGKIVGLLGISLNISDRKQMEAELKKAKEAAEAASKAKTEFILNMEHDIRTPIAHIISFSDILAKDGNIPPETLRQYLGYINTSGRRLMDLIAEILTFADIEQGNMPLREKIVNLRKIVDDIIGLEMPAIKNKNLELILDCAETLPQFYSDHARLHRILLNLVSNSIKYTEQGHVKITITVTKINGAKGKDGKAKLVLCVEDTGIGIPKDKHEVIFERFAKLSPSNKNKFFKGLGLGLWIVKQFVRDLGGDIGLESEVGKGSSFVVVVPVQLVKDSV